MSLSSLFFAIMGITIKQLSNDIGSVEIVFFRNIFGVIFILASFYHIKDSSIGGKKFVLFFRGFIGFIALLMFFYNIVHLSLSEAIVFSKTSPIFTAIIAFFVFKERLSYTKVLAILVGFIGVVLITDISHSLDKSDYLGILCGLLSAMAYTAVKELREYYDSRVIVLSFVIIGSVLPIIFMMITPFVKNTLILEYFDFIISPFVMPQNSDWGYIFIMGVFATLAQILMTKAYGYSKAGIVSTVSYSTIAFSMIFGIFIGDSLPNNSVIFGIILIILSGIMVARK
jgi:drug/metabolite transporter (DMT)-like permease